MSVQQFHKILLHESLSVSLFFSRFHLFFSQLPLHRYVLIYKLLPLKYNNKCQVISRHSNGEMLYCNVMNCNVILYFQSKIIKCLRTAKKCKMGFSFVF